MWIPLAILAVLSLVRRLHQHPEIPGADVPAAGRRARATALDRYVSVAAGLVGIALAYLFYRGRARASGIAGAHASARPTADLQQVFRRRVLRFDRGRARWSTARAAALARRRRAADRRHRERNRQRPRAAIGGILRRAQSGYIRSYAAWVVPGSILVIAYIGIHGSVAMTLLDVVLFLPLVGFLLLLLISQSNPSSAWPRWSFRWSIFVVSLGLLGAVLVSVPVGLHLLDRRFRGSAIRPSAITSAWTA